MIDAIIKKIDSTYPFTSKSLGYVVKKEISEVFYPCHIVNNEYKQLIDFQKLNDFNYWYLTNDVNVSEVLNQYSNKRIYELNYPLRLFICRKNICDENLVLNFFKEVENLNMAVRVALGIHNFKMNIKSYNLIRNVVLEQEFNMIPKLMEKYSVVSMDIDIAIQVDKNCLEVC